MTIKLHVGCGPNRILDGWHNLDRDESGIGDPSVIIHDVSTGLPYQNSSVGLIYSEDFFEHIDQREQICFLAECHRVLSFGGWCRISTPCLRYSMQRWSDFSKGRDGVHVKEWDQHKHKLLVTEGYMREIAEMVGFNVVFNSKNKSLVPDMPDDSRPLSDRELGGNIWADLQKDDKEADAETLHCLAMACAYDNEDLTPPPHCHDS